MIGGDSSGGGAIKGDMTMTRQMTKLIPSRHCFAAFLLLGALAAASGCAPGQAQRPDHGPMGSTATGTSADRPDRNSQSLPIEKPL